MMLITATTTTKKDYNIRITIIGLCIESFFCIAYLTYRILLCNDTDILPVDELLKNVSII